MLLEEYKRTMFPISDREGGEKTDGKMKNDRAGVLRRQESLAFSLETENQNRWEKDGGKNGRVKVQKSLTNGILLFWWNTIHPTCSSSNMHLSSNKESINLFSTTTSPLCPSSSALFIPVLFPQNMSDGRIKKESRNTLRGVIHHLHRQMSSVCTTTTQNKERCIQVQFSANNVIIREHNSFSLNQRSLTTHCSPTSYTVALGVSVCEG